MSIEELLQLRYKVISDYPHSPYKVGDIIDFSETETQVITRTPWYDPEWAEMTHIDHNCPIAEFEKYKALFQPLPWWAERKPEEMPAFVKQEGIVYEATWIEGVETENGLQPMRMDLNDGYSSWAVISNVMCHFEPATEAEYTAYITQTQQP